MAHRYEPTRKASPELRRLMRSPLFVPDALTDDELQEFAAYLTAQGVQVHWVRLDGFSTDQDVTPHAFQWRIQRGEIRERVA